MKKREITNVLKAMEIGDEETFSIFQETSIRGTISRFKSNEEMHQRVYSVVRVDKKTCKVIRKENQK